MVKYADGPRTEVSIDIAAPVETVWELVSDINTPAAYSQEFVKGEWISDEPGVGATFRGFNSHPVVGEWSVLCTMTAFEPGATFEWSIGEETERSARWRFDVEPTEGGSTLRFSAEMGPGPSGLTPAIEAMPDKEEAIVERRLAEWTGNMTATVEGIKALAEAE